MKEHHVLRELRMTLEMVRPDAEKCAAERRRARELLAAFIHGHTTAQEILDAVTNRTRH